MGTPRRTRTPHLRRLAAGLLVAAQLLAVVGPPPPAGRAAPCAGRACGCPPAKSSCCCSAPQAEPDAEACPRCRAKQPPPQCGCSARPCRGELPAVVAAETDPTAPPEFPAPWSPDRPPAEHARPADDAADTSATPPPVRPPRR